MLPWELAAAAANNPTLKYLQQQIAISQQETELQKTKRLPDFFGGYYNQSIRGFQNVNGFEQKFSGLRRFHAVQVGIAIPILPGGYKSKVEAAKINELSFI